MTDKSPILLRRSTEKPVYIFGAGGHANVISDILAEAGISITGNIVDSGYEPKETQGTIIETFQFMASKNPKNCLLVFGIGTISSTEMKQSRIELLTKAGFDFISVIAKTSVISRSANIHVGAQVFEGAIVNSFATVDSHSVVNTGAILEHGVRVGKYSHVAPGAVVCGNSKIGTGTHIGANSTVLQNIQIGSNCTIGAGAVVTRDVPSGTTVFGVPARIH